MTDELPLPVPDTEPVPPHRPVDEGALRLAEALLFASAEPIGARALGQLLDADSDPDAVLLVLRDRYAGRGVELVDVAGGWQFRTAPDLIARLTRVVEKKRRLPRAAMETLAIIAYHQPVTRPDIEQLRGASLSQSTMDALLEAGLIESAGRKDVPGRPTLWATTQTFLSQFGLKTLRDLPRREDLLVEPHAVGGTQAVPETDRNAEPAAETTPEMPRADQPSGMPEGTPGRT